MALAAVVAGCGPTDPDGGTPGEGWEPEWPPPTELGPADRAAPLLLPDAYDGTSPVPLVLVLGGYWNLAEELDDWFGVSDRVDEDGFALLLPDGTIDSEGAPFWNATDTCCDYDGTDVDDAGWLLGLIEETRARVAIDPAGVVAVGHSNGGFMAFALACEEGSPLTGVFSLAGSSWMDPDDCAASHAIDVLQVHGDVDDVMPYEGDDVGPGALEVAARWSERGGCDPGLAPNGSREYVDDGVDDETEVSRALDCTDGSVELWTMTGADHYPDVTAGLIEDALARLLDD
ncbi:MAG: hypothetical protein GY898_30010 [Proteobacteria bacterium]|nr:hypothetical protein [Pseudomonadota bacterium]